MPSAPAPARWPPKRLTPSRWPGDLRPFFDEPPAFFVAFLIWICVPGAARRASRANIAAAAERRRSGYFAAFGLCVVGYALAMALLGDRLKLSRAGVGGLASTRAEAAARPRSALDARRGGVLAIEAPSTRGRRIPTLEAPSTRAEAAPGDSVPPRGRRGRSHEAGALFAGLVLVGTPHVDRAKAAVAPLAALFGGMYVASLGLVISSGPAWNSISRP